MSALPVEVQEELRHPFTLRVFLELRSQEGGIPPIPTKASLLECWLNRRLDAESSPGDRVTRSLFQKALRTLAGRATDANSGSICVDELSDMPRFDPAHPPGPVLQRLIEANILETVPGQSDRIRFAIEAVQDFYRADADVVDIKAVPAAMAEAYSRLTFTTAYTRLERIGHQLAGEAARDEFARRLAELDARMAAVVVRTAVDRFSPDIRKMIADELGRQISAQHRVRAAMAITLLGRLDCQEAIEVLAAQEPLLTGRHRYLKARAARAFIKLGHAPATPFVFRWARFGLTSDNQSIYIDELLCLIRNSTTEFRHALADEAIQRITNASGSPEHAKAVMVLAYLGDDRLVPHLEERLAVGGWLHPYESHALIALGTDQAGSLFTRCFASIEALLPDAHGDHDRSLKGDLLLAMTFELPGDIRHLLTPAFERCLKRLFESNDARVRHIAANMARNSLAPALLCQAVLSEGPFAWHAPFDDVYRTCISPDEWLNWWRTASTAQMKRRLMQIPPLHPSVEVEEILVECLEVPELSGPAARKLGELGIVRSAAVLRRVLAGSLAGEHGWTQAEAAHALGDLRDEAAVSALVEVAREHPDEWTFRQAVWSLGLIGGGRVEWALQELLCRGGDEKCDNVVSEALLLCGSKTAVRLVIEQAKSKSDGPHWLFERLNLLGWVRGSRRDEFYIHIECDDLVAYLKSHYPKVPPGQDRMILDAFGRIDGPPVRDLLREWAVETDSINIRLNVDGGRRPSNIYFEILQQRGDESAIDYTLDEGEGDRAEMYVSMVADRLQRFPKTAVLRNLRLRLAEESDKVRLASILALLGRYGEPDDAELAVEYLDHPDELVANLACETMLRLSDPLLVPDRWREL